MIDSMTNLLVYVAVLVILITYLIVHADLIISVACLMVSVAYATGNEIIVQPGEYGWCFNHYQVLYIRVMWSQKLDLKNSKRWRNKSLKLIQRK